MRDDVDETTLQENADLSAKLPSTDDATPGTAPGEPELDGQDQVVAIRDADAQRVEQTSRQQKEGQAQSSQNQGKDGEQKTHEQES